MKLFTALILSLGIVFAFTSNVFAESRVVSKHHNWEVAVVTFDRGDSFHCSMEIFHRLDDMREA